MLEKPDLDETRIRSCLNEQYGLSAKEVVFLPLGADQDTAVYRARTAGGGDYFVKLRGGRLFEPAITLPRFLSDSGTREVIPSIPAADGRLWADLGPYRLILSPYIHGRNGFEVPLATWHWIEFGRMLKALHTAAPPDSITREIPRETLDPTWRRQVERFLVEIKARTYPEPVAAEMAGFLRTRQKVLAGMIARADRLAAATQLQDRPFVVCHADIHVGNLHITDSGSLYLIDWDTLKLAPLERDLMFIGGGLGGGWLAPEEELEWFYQGYGPVRIDQALLAYYRYDRILEDIAVYCRQILMSDAGSADRPQSLRYLESNFRPGGTIDLAFRTDPGWPGA